MLYRVLGMVGRTMIASGVILLLFVAYQLWGTGLQTRQAQDRLEDQFEQRLAGLEESERTGAPDGSATTTTTPTPTPTTATHPRTGSRPSPSASPPRRRRRAGSPSTSPARRSAGSPSPTSAPTGSSSRTLDLRYLRDWAGTLPRSAVPLAQEGNAALAGTRTTYGAPFHRLDESDPGDEITVATPQGEFTYRVLSAGELSADMPFDVDADQADEGHFIVGPRDSWILDDYGDDRLTLMACHPKYSAAQRIVTVAELVGPPAPTPEEAPQPDTEAIGDLAGGDDTKRLPAVLWALAAAAVWFTFWYLGRVWRRWPAYVLGTPVFLVVLFVCFTFVEQLLPAAY
ncbi:MAG: sortase [Acidimicrobiia bacterium]|nr:sortase [Acidimicrobiia bacterium]